LALHRPPLHLIQINVPGTARLSFAITMTPAVAVRAANP
jgi:hypothetical protein